MTTPSAASGTGERFVRTGMLWLQRIAGLALFAIGVGYWVRLVGVFPGPNWRFDLMSVEWRAAASMLAVLCPVAGVGLWMASSWGVVVWVLVATVEIVMHTALRRTFGGFAAEPALLVAGLVLFAMLRFARWVQRRRARRSERSG